MRIVIQRVSRAEVRVGGQAVGAVGHGLAILVGVRQGDTETDADHLAAKALSLRIFQDEEGKMNLSAGDVGGEFLVVSQFTLYADTSRGRRPSFIQAAEPAVGERLYQRFVSQLREAGARVETGQFGSEMEVDLINQGPVTIILDSDNRS